ncbi:alpha/beta hydrolase [Mycobacterium sp. 1274756.6]|uniref:alpha/beta fold hydrolase n=1 Tax=Mycobacterium sp. 1274756.6 TaxID=1834076 RepID=UPI0007FEF021|nr:alpha/beta hydrolase [Mycobacterium sp. 1274756.6]OBJ68296.1 hypothetical protein A5643_14240 [Mycobacterium sp. 1274756.6]
MIAAGPAGEVPLVRTALGPVQVAIHGDPRAEPVLFFPGGHSTALTPACRDLYVDLGYRVISFSRPGYGRTAVGALTAARFVPAVTETWAALGLPDPVAAVGLSFGGLQAVHLATAAPRLAPRLILHSAAPSTLGFPDTAAERLAAPVAFGPRTQRLTWAAVRRLVSTDRGLRMMMRPLSTLPVRRWWAGWSAADRAAARAVFAHMASGSGFLLDVAQGTPAGAAERERLLRSVGCPTLVTASRYDGGVALRHAEDFRRTIAHARLVSTDAVSHFFWLGDSRGTVAAAVADFLTG